MPPERLLPMVGCAALLLSGCGGSDGSGRAAPTAPADAPTFKVEDPGPVHVHGLGTDPADGSLFIATHTGLFRAPAGQLTARRVADRYQDTMGFTVIGPHRFLGSGHPDLRTGQPPFLGLIRSSNAGRSWQHVSLLGKSDFHVLEASGSRVVGYGSDLKTRRPVFLRSDDRGKTWTDLGRIPPLVSLAISPDEPDLWAASSDNQIFRTRDGGRTFNLIASTGGLLGWRPDGELFAMDPDGHVSISSDEGSHWKLRGWIRGAPAAFEAEQQVLLAALHDGTIRVSINGGRTWVLRSRPKATVTSSR